MDPNRQQPPSVAIAIGVGTCFGAGLLALYPHLPAASWISAALSITGLSSFTFAVHRMRQMMARNAHRIDTLSQSEHWLSAMLLDGSDWCWESDQNHRFTKFSKGFHERFRIPPESSLGKTRADLAADFIRENPDIWADHKHLLDRYEAFTDFTYYTYSGDGGQQRWIRATGRPRFDEFGRFLGYRGVASDVTAEHAARAEAEVVQDLLLSSLDAVAAGLALFDADDQLTRFNRNVAERARSMGVHLHVGMTFENMIRGLAATGFKKHLDPTVTENWIADRLSRHRVFNIPFTYRSFNGQWLQVSEHPLPDGGVVVLTTDISEVKSKEEEKRQQEMAAHYAKLQQILNNLGQGVCLTDKKGRAESWNPLFLDMLELPEECAEIGWSLRNIIDMAEEQRTTKHECFAQQIAEDLLDGSTSEFAGGIIERTRSDGTVIEIRLNPLPDGGKLMVFTDITERKRGEDIVVYMANHDPLTDLPNRSLFKDRLTQAMAQADRKEERVAVLYFDLDGFKDVNDTVGHSAGDELLIEVSNRLNAIARAADSVSRLGGDEFAIIQTGLTSPSDAAVLALRILESLAHPFTILGQHVEVTASIGITVFPDDAENVNELLQAADLAMYRAKSESGGAYRFYEARMNMEVQERKALESDIRSALELDQFTLAYQPKCDLETGKITAVEALIRWDHVERGQVPARQIIDVAEASGLIVPLGEWVLHRALRDLASWPGAVESGMRVAVNLSPLQFRRQNLVHLVADALAAANLPASSLELEITEGILLPELEGNLETLQALSDLGVHIAIDDFGTGYSSLAYLQQFPVHTLKIDRRFILDIDHRDDSKRLVKAMVEMGRTLNLVTVAEGIENEEHLSALKDLGCHVGQGYFLHRPLPANDLSDILTQEDAKDPQHELDAATPGLEPDPYNDPAPAPTTPPR